KAIAALFTQQGAKVLIVYHNDQQGAEQAVAELTAQGGICSALRADVSQEQQMQAMAATALERYGSIDILCANAAGGTAGPLDQLTEEAWDSVQAINLKGTFLSVKACLPQMKAQQYGKIVVTSSVTGPRVAYAGLSNYGASKAGQIGFVTCA